MARSLFVAVVLATAIASCGGGGGDGGNAAPEPLPGSSVSELNVTITGASIDANGSPVVTYVVSDSEGDPRSPVGVRTRFVIAARQANGQFRDYITVVQTSPTTSVTATQAGFEDSSVGSLEDLGGGRARYTFRKMLPAGYDRDAVHRVALFADTTVLGVAYVANAVFDFVPSGGPVDPAASDVVRLENCNTCHDPLEAHGGTRRDVRLCVSCHSSEITNPETGQSTPHIDPDTGHNIGFIEMIHKIHRGENLPSVEAGTPYQIIGFNQGVNDYSEVAFPQDIRNCEKCHGGAAQGEWFMTRPTRQACGSCHDDVNFASGEGHGGGAYLDDFSCSSCHLPQGEHEFDISVVGTHVIPAHSQQAPGVRAEIVRVTSLETGSTTVAPGEHPVVAFRLTTTAGEAIVPSSLNALQLTLAGPTREYSAQDYDGDGEIVPGDPSSPWTPGAETFSQESPLREAQAGSEPGVFTYAFKGTLPMNATGTYAVGIEGYKCATIQGANQSKGGINCSGNRDTNGNGREDSGEVFDEIRDAIPNVVFYFAVTDPEPLPRRTVVAIEQCSACHGIFSKDFSVHGGNRNDTEYCALCHNPSNDTLSRQLPDVGVTAMTSPVDFKIMIHKIHRGENLTTPYLLYGRPSGQFPNQTENPLDFSHLLFPGDLRDCEACHRPETFVLQPERGVLGPGVLGPTTRTFVREERSKRVLNEFTTPRTIAVCTACHDDVHFDTGENHPAGPATEDTCGDCHGVGHPLSVERTHLPGLAPEDRIHRPN